MTAPEAGRRSHDQRHPITCFRWGSYCTADGFCAAGTNQQRASTAPLRLKSKAFHRSIGSKTFDGRRTRIWTNGKRASHSSMRGCFRSSTRTPNAPSRPSAPFSSLFPREQARKSCSQKITSVRRERSLDCSARLSSVFPDRESMWAGLPSEEGATDRFKQILKQQRSPLNCDIIDSTGLCAGKGRSKA